MKLTRFFSRCGLFFACLLVVSGCKPSDNDDTVRDLPFVVYFDQTENRYLLQSVKTDNGKSDLILYADVIANSSTVEEGLPGIGDFKVDFKNKVASKFYNAETITWREAPLSKFTMDEDPDNVQGDSIKVTWSKGSSFIGSTFFVKLTQDVQQGSEYDYWLNYDEAVEVEDDVYTLQLNARKTTEPAEDAAVEKKTIGLTFDMRDFFVRYANRNTFGFVVKYMDGIDERGLNKEGKYTLPSKITVNPVGGQ